jgi:hypothetical protein
MFLLALFGLPVSTEAKADIITWNFTGIITKPISGYLAGDTITGSFSFDNTTSCDIRTWLLKCGKPRGITSPN